MIHVTDPAGELPPFAYSVGIVQSADAPEVIVIGLKQPMAHFVVNEYNQRVRAGERFVPGELYQDFLGGHDVRFERVSAHHFDEYFGWGRDHYGHPDYRALQLVYPTTDGIWPDEPDASDWFKERQTLLFSARGSDDDPSSHT